MPRRLREVEGDEIGDFFQFDNLGDAVEGIYVKERTSNSGNFGPQQVYDIREEDGQLVTVTGTWDIKSKMAKVPIGSYVKIEYVNNKELPPARDGTARNPMKMFKVQTDAPPSAAAAPPKQKAQDEDGIPF